MDPSPITLGSVNIEAADPLALVEFWAGVTGATPSVNEGSAYLPPVGPGGFAMFFQPLTAPRPAHVPVHLDLTVPWQTRSTEVDRLVALGATKKWDVLDEHPHVRWTTLADPEGNLFCVAEHPPAAEASA
ncbi:VOC family protein [Knoellia sp. LjRoot47]|uniref:VOC family protein n=1 Tax=Knoellia sp. LjRoot47 TaxID=3342330 RepID=UPI003ECEEB05